MLKSQPAHDFVFESCAAALRAFLERRPALVDLAKAIAIARLEATGDYVEAVHDRVFSEFGETPVDAELVPAYLVRLNARDLQAARECLPGRAFGERPAGEDPRGAPRHRLVGGGQRARLGAQARALAGLALGANEVFLVQSAASNLHQLREKVRKALEYSRERR